MGFSMKHRGIHVPLEFLAATALEVEYGLDAVEYPISIEIRFCR